MNNLTITIKNVKSISDFELSLPLQKGIFALIGNNGTGKSTIINCLAQLVADEKRGIGLQTDEGREGALVCIKTEERSATWRFLSGSWSVSEPPERRLHYEGMYERSLFYAPRFNDSRIVDKKFRQNQFPAEAIVDADEYVKDQLSFILHGNFEHYRALKRLKGEARRKLNLKNIPYFNVTDGQLISQYKMSSGECLLISLLHFINNAIIKKNLPEGEHHLHAHRRN